MLLPANPSFIKINTYSLQNKMFRFLFRSFHSEFGVRLKWPNDIYYKNEVLIKKNIMKFPILL